jgi:hypothetical protein
MVSPRQQLVLNARREDRMYRVCRASAHFFSLFALSLLLPPS